MMTGRDEIADGLRGAHNREYGCYFDVDSDDDDDFNMM
jgi:hypothetical protein